MADGQPPPYQPYPYPQAQPGQATATTVHVVAHQPTVMVAQTPVFRDYPVTIIDSKGQQVQTVLEYRSGLLTWIAVGVILLFTAELCLCCLAIIPFFINDLKDVYHISPTDGSVVGVYKRIS